MTRAKTATIAIAVAPRHGTVLGARAIEPAFSIDLVVDGATTTDDGRSFVVA